MSERNTFQGQTGLYGQLPSLEVPPRAHVRPDDLRLEDLEDNAPSTSRHSTRTLTLMNSITASNLLNAFFDTLSKAITPSMLAYRNRIDQCCTSTQSLLQDVFGYGRDIVRILKVLYQLLGLCVVSSYLGFLQTIFDVKRELDSVSASGLPCQHLSLLHRCFDFSGGRSQVLPYDRLDAQPPYLEPAQCCFVCFDVTGEDTKAIKLHIKRPVKHRRIRRWTTDITGKLKTICYERIQRCEWAVESDADVYFKIKEVSLSACGGWSRFMPLYGIKAVREVEFEFRGGTNSDGSFPIVVHSIDLQMIKNQVNGIISSAAADDDPCHNNSCDEGSGWHSQGCKTRTSQLGEPCIQQLPGPIRRQLQPEYHSLGCQTLTDHYNEICIQEQAQQAKRRKKKLESLSLLTKCVHNPKQANGEMTLEGMALESCVMQLRGDSCVVVPQRNCPYNGSDRLRGLQVTMGWRHDQLSEVVPFGFGWSALAISSVWLCTVWWMKGTRDVSTAMAFGQLLAASISLVFLTMKR